MKTLEVKIKAQKESSYPILIANGILDSVYNYIKKYTRANKYLIVTNTTVYGLYGEKLQNANAHFCVLPDGESYKTTEYLNQILDMALKSKLERKDAIIALGGGVIGDMAGFAAAVYQRGIDFIQIPTTLLAQVDSSVGGKVAVNHKLGKNMIGAFYQPKLVITDINTLSTLDERQFKTGMSEVIKYAFIEKSCDFESNFNMLDFLHDFENSVKAKNPEVLINLVSACCKLKSAVVNKDEKEKGLRAILNLGHTYAHAIENITNYEKYTHGEAVSIGMKMAFNLSLSLNKINRLHYDEAMSLLKLYNLTTQLDFTPAEEKFYNTMLSDKKVSDGEVVFVLPSGTAQVEIVKNIDKKLVIEGIK